MRTDGSSFANSTRGRLMRRFFILMVSYLMVSGGVFLALVVAGYAAGSTAVSAWAFSSAAVTLTGAGGICSAWLRSPARVVATSASLRFELPRRVVDIPVSSVKEIRSTGVTRINPRLIVDAGARRHVFHFVDPEIGRSIKDLLGAR